MPSLLFRASLIFVATLALHAAPAPPTPASPAATSLSSPATTPSTPDKFADLPAKMQPFVDQGQVSGLVVLVADKDKILHTSAVGVSDVATGRKLETGDLFWVASMTKPMAAVAIALLKDDGKLSFDDPVEKYLPEFKNVRAPGGQNLTRPITLRDLMTHTSGLGDYSLPDPHWTLDQISQDAASRALRSQPGTAWRYSTTGFNLLGRVVEVVSGKSFDKFLQERLFDPLGMTHSTFWVAEADVPRVAKSYSRNTQTGKLEETTISYMYGAPITDKARPPIGGAGLFTTADDIAKFYQMALNHGTYQGKVILKPATVAEMLTKQTGELTARPGMPWGLGFCIIEDPKAMAANAMLNSGAFGHGGAYGTSSWADPKTGLIYVIMLQRKGLPNPDDSDMHRVFQETAVADFAK